MQTNKTLWQVESPFIAATIREENLAPTFGAPVKQKSQIF